MTASPRVRYPIEPEVIRTGDGAPPTGRGTWIPPTPYDVDPAAAAGPRRIAAHQVVSQ